MSKAPNVALAVLVLTAIVAVNALVLHGRLSHWAADITAPMLTPLVARTSAARAYIGALFSRGDLAAENIRLSEELDRVRAQAAATEELQRELAFYRAVAGIAEHLRREPVAAGIFAYPRAGGVREALVNKGSRDWVALGDVVVTPDGALVGAVQNVFDDHAVVLMLGDPSFEVTGRIEGTEISGLVRADGADGLVLDLVSRDEAVSEGQVVVTSGNDRFPAGLLVGTVRSVDANQTTLFTVVRLDPTADYPPAGRVIIIRPQ
jgi:rod shape-determining protein MreC